MKKKSFDERYGNEVLSDNTHVEYCSQCKNCKLRDDGTIWSNDYKKSNCQMYVYPNSKPWEVINNRGICSYRTT